MAKFKFNPVANILDAVNNKATEITVTDWRSLQEIVDSFWNALVFKWEINLASDFPTILEVVNWWTYVIKTWVTDNDPTKTNTLQTFLVWEYIAWNGTNWTVMTKYTEWWFIGWNILNQIDLQTALSTKLDDLTWFTTDDLQEWLVNKYLSWNAFDKSIDTLDDITEWTTNLFMTSPEKTKLNNLQDYFKGFFIDELALNTAIPVWQVWWYALVWWVPSDTFYYWETTGSSWVNTWSTSTWDMLKAVYDPQNINWDVYDMANMIEAIDAKIMTAQERQDIIDLKDDIILKANITDVLEKDNTTIYTPSNPYEPATKKYVDDNAVLGWTYTNLNATPTTIWGISAWSTFNSKSMTEMWDSLLYPYQNPAFTWFTYWWVTTPIEVWSILSWIKTFTWTTSNPWNITPNAISIRDNTAWVNLATWLSNDWTEDLDIWTVIQNIATSNVWRISWVNTKAWTFTRDLTVNWQWMRYYWESANTVLNETEIKALRVNWLSAWFAWTYSFNAWGYKYIAYASALWTATTFKDQATNLDVAMQLPYTVSITNAQWITTNYNVHRTLNQLWWAINIIVS